MGQGNLAGPIIIAIGVIVAAMAFALVNTLLQTADGGTDLRLTRLEERIAAEQAARARVEEDLRQLGTDMRRLRDEMSLIANRAPEPQPDTRFMDTSGIEGLIIGEGEDFENPAATEGLTEAMILARTQFNRGVTQPRNSVMLEILGHPRTSYAVDCEPMTNPVLRAITETRDFGPFRATMLRPALDSLERVMDRLRESDPDIHEHLGTAGALCARLIRGSTSAISNHSWGTAIDLTLKGELDGFGDGTTQFGLLILAEYFNDEGWFWGATFSREDSMHFEVGEEKLRRWKAEGLLPGG